MKGSNAAIPERLPTGSSKPQPSRGIDFRVAVAAGLLAALVLGISWYLCRLSDRIALLPKMHGAEWIIFPKPVEATMDSAYPQSATFRRSFVLQSPSPKPAIKLFAYKTFSLLINGRPVPVQRENENGWKRLILIDASEFLRAGTNEITAIVTNTTGPPALWLRIESGNQVIATDNDWEVSLAGSLPEHACLAREVLDKRADKSLQGGERTIDSVARIGPWLIILAVVSFVIVMIVERVLRTRRENSQLILGRSINYLLVLILFARFLICFHNIPLLPRSMGFDAEAHEDYIKFVCEKRALPLAKDGWEMFQPPLYYTMGALVAEVDGGYGKNQHTTTLLRGINGVIGLLQCWLVLLCLKRMLPDDFGAQAAGLTLAAFLPPNLNLSQYVTNEPLTALFATAAFYFLLRSVTNEKLSDYIGLGMFLGLAMLTKFSSLPIVAGAAGALGLRMSQKKLRASPNFWRGPLAVLICFLLVCSWHYLRVWISSGQPLVGNWESTSQFAWRQDPGFRVSEYYLNFGSALVAPLFSSFHSFADGIYSTLWGDSLVSGAARLTSRPPWNYDWMNASYLLAIGLSIITVVGIILLLVFFCRNRSPQWFFVLWSLGAFAAAILFMSLRVPTYAQIKAFYGMPALASLAVAFAIGWKELLHRWPLLRLPMWTILLLWVACVTTAFWIRKDNPETWLVRGLYLTQDAQDSQAIENLTVALEKDADVVRTGGKSLSLRSKLEGHFNLGLILDRQGQVVQAMERYREALKIDPDFDGALNNLAWLLATCSNASLRNGSNAVTLARRACDLTQERTTVYIGTLAAAYAETGNFPEAISTAERAIRCARLRGEEALARRNGELLETYRAGKPYREPVGP
jgi:4-amino-4-deoxy-L-arabinose transferase-like glycosyltransferase